MNALAHWFALTAGTILAVTGVAKIWSGLGNSTFIAISDPIVGIKFGQLLLVAGVVEIGIAFECLFGRRLPLALALVAWMSSSFMAYRFGLWWINWKRPCDCLGNLTDALHISPQTADNISKVLLVYLLVGSYSFLLWHWRQRRGEAVVQ